MNIIREVGFVDLRVEAPRYDAFSGSTFESSSADYGTVGIVISARKPSAD